MMQCGNYHFNSWQRTAVKMTSNIPQS